MFPNINLFWFDIYFQWVWIILASLIFFYWMYRYTNKLKLKFSNIFSFIPLFIIVSYVLWRYSYNLIEYGYDAIFSFMNLSLLSPYNYRFSFVWVSLWILIVSFIFLIWLSYEQERKKYIDALFFSITLSLVIIWPFLLLWDIFYWTTTSSVFGINVFTENTQIPFTSKIWPVWIFVSILWILLYFLSKISYFIFKKAWSTIYFLPLLFLWFALIFHFQHYPKHFLLTIDIKILYCYIMAILAPTTLYLLSSKNK